MEHFQTPKKPVSKLLNDGSVVIPESPAMARIGWGTGVGIYSLARSPVCGKFRSPWAIKKVITRKANSEYENRLIAEADILKSLNHPNIVGFRALVENKDGFKCLAMEECETSLGELIEDRNCESQGPFPVNNILTVVTDISKALSYLHDECHILHGDLKSFNILIRGNFEVAKLCDFGVSVRLNLNGVALPGQTYVGTECWSAPEVLEDSVRNITTKADIFSFGLIVWEMITLRVPHASLDESDESANDNDTSLLGAVGSRPDLPSDLRTDYEEVTKIFIWCTHSDPFDRPSAANILEHLHASDHT